MNTKLMLLGVGAALCMSPLASATTPAEAKKAITEKFVVTKRSVLTAKVSQPGTIAVIQRPGLSADPGSKSFMKPVVIKEGVAVTAGGGDVLGPSGGKAMEPGARVYIYSVDVNASSVTIIYATVDTMETTQRGSTNYENYKGSIVFKYDGGLAAIEASKVLADLELWLKTEAESATSVSAAKTIALGQTPEEVEAILGVPDKKVDLGPKKIFYYKDMKVTFTDGKVSDVE